jgi:hypothetical protein
MIRRNAVFIKNNFRYIYKRGPGCLRGFYVLYNTTVH